MKRLACAAIFIGLSSLAGMMTVAPASWASAVDITTNSQDKDDSDLEQGVPGRRVGGGTRGDQVFANADAAMAALVNPSNLSMTTSAYPTLLFYVPEMVSANSVEFVLRDSRDQLIYETTFQLSRTGGLVSVQTAGDDVPSLNLNEDYQWYFSIVPDPADRANDVVVEGRIRRVDQRDWLAQQQVTASVREQIAIAPPLTQARLLYQQANLWHDAALILAELRQREPEDPAIAAEWNQLLDSVGLLSIVQDHPAPIQIGLN